MKIRLRCVSNLTSEGVRGITRLTLGAILTYSFSFHASGQLNVTGQASAAFLSAQDGPSQYAYNAGRGTFAWRGDLFLDAELSERIFFESSLRIDQDQQLYVDLFSIRCTELFSLPLSIEAGQIDLPFASLGERRYPKTNPFLALPLIREHVTTLRSSDYELWIVDSRFTIAGNGMHILDQGLYDIGVKAYGSIGIVDYAVAITNGMLSSTSNYTTTGLNGKRGFGKIVRAAITPTTGLTIGASYAQGPFLRNGSSYYSGYSYSTEYDPNEYSQETIGSDIDFSFEHFTFYGEGFSNTWKFNHVYGTDLRATGYSVEGRYTAIPRLSFAVRVAQIFFNRITTTTIQPGYSVVYSGVWDHDVIRTEAAIGYRLNRETLLKAVYQWNRTIDFYKDPRDNVFGVETVVSF